MWIIGMAKTTASIASILNQTSTIFIAFFGWLILKEKFSRSWVDATTLIPKRTFLPAPQEFSTPQNPENFLTEPPIFYIVIDII